MLEKKCEVKPSLTLFIFIPSLLSPPDTIPSLFHRKK
jgi:hypothetical protein